MPPRRPTPPPHVVLSVGGSVLTSARDPAEYYERLAALLVEVAHDQPLVVTTGGGRTAREYIQLGRQLGLTEVELDEVGIEVTRLHARLLAARLGEAAPARPPTSLAEAVQESRRHRIVVMGGTEPGHTTDGVAAMAAARLRAALVVNATRVDGLYDQDPRQHPNARRIERLGFEEFLARVRAATDTTAGQEFVFDRLGAETLARARIPVVIVDGADLANLALALRGAPCSGTHVGPAAPP